MPGDILNNGAMALEDCLRVDDILTRRRRSNIPQADGAIIRRRQQHALCGRIPRKAIALLRVTAQAQLRLAHTIGFRCRQKSFE